MARPVAVTGAFIAGDDAAGGGDWAGHRPRWPLPVAATEPVIDGDDLPGRGDGRSPASFAVS